MPKNNISILFVSLKRQKKLSTCYEAQVAFVSRVLLNV